MLLQRSVFWRSGRGFTLIELLIVIVILAVLGIVGMTVFTSVTDRAEDARRTSDVQAIAKALEVNYNPLVGYVALNGNQFSDGTIPIPPEGGSYFSDFVSGGGFRVCTAKNGGSNPCTANSATCFCKESIQITYTGSPSPSPSASPTTSPSPSPSPSPDALATGLVGYWKMDELSWTNNCSTTSVLNSAGGNNGASCPASTGPAGGAASKPGFGYAGSFDGVDDIVQVSGFNVNGVPALTVAMWVNFSNTTERVTINLPSSFDMRTGTNRVTFSVNTTAGFTVYRPTVTVAINQWRHIAGVYDGANMYVYLDGSLVNFQAKTGTVMTASSPLTMGLMGGLLDEVRIYNRALSAAEVLQLYNLIP